MPSEMRGAMMEATRERRGMGDEHARNFAYKRYHLSEEGWKPMESGRFLSYANTPRGVGRCVVGAVRHIDKGRDMVVFKGRYLRDKGTQVVGVWVPSMGYVDGMEYVGEVPREFEELRLRCARYVMGLQDHSPR